MYRTVCDTIRLIRVSRVPLTMTMTMTMTMAMAMAMAMTGRCFEDAIAAATCWNVALASFGSSVLASSRAPLIIEPTHSLLIHSLTHSLTHSLAHSLTHLLTHSLSQVCLQLVLPGARRTARSNTCHAGLARSPVGAAPAQQAVQRCARTAGRAALLSHATMAQGPSQTDLAQRALLGASPPWSCQRGAGRPAPDSRGPPPP